MSGGLTLQAVSIRLDGREIAAVDQTIAPGETLTVMGPSGAGKSSLLAFVAGFLGADFDASGRVLVDGRDVTTAPAETRRIGLLFQDPLLFPHLSVRGNLLFALPRGGRDRTARADAALAEVGLEGFGDRDPATLSGGQQARVALLRTLLSEPRAVLLDEPFSRLDAALRQEVRALVFGRLRAARLPAILVTHDPEDADAAGGPLLTLSG